MRKVDWAPRRRYKWKPGSVWTGGQAVLSLPSGEQIRMSDAEARVISDTMFAADYVRWLARILGEGFGISHRKIEEIFEDPAGQPKR